MGKRFVLLILFFLPSCSTLPQDDQTNTKRLVRQPINSFSNQELLNQKIPAFTAKTIQGEGVDSNYFTNKITLINFMYIGCQPCMQEAPLLNQLHQDTRSDNFQMLCIAPQTPQQMKKLYPYFIPYAIIAECSKEDALGQPAGPDCRSISKQFLVRGYPTTLLIDGKGIIRYRHLGFSNQRPPDFKAEIKTLLREAKM